MEISSDAARIWSSKLSLEYDMERLKAATDRDFFFSVAISGAKFVYQPGCDSIYRRYGNVTASTSNKTLWRDYHFLVMEKAEAKLTQLDKLPNSYRQALADSYFGKIRAARADIDYSQYLWVLNKIISLCPNFRGESQAAGYNLIQKTLGFKNAEIGLRFLKQLTNNRKTEIQSS